MTTNLLEYTVMEIIIKVKEFYASANMADRTEKYYFKELASCILGSSIRFEVAKSYLDQMEQLGFLDFESALLNIDEYENNLESVLAAPTVLYKKYRYPKSKANYISRTINSIYGNGITISELLCDNTSHIDTRKAIMERAVGIGPKQASLFLRNIGHSEHIAILDKHVLNYMRIMKISKKPQINISSLKRYEKIEESLISYSKKLNTKLSILDTAIWVVMRTYQREGTA